MPYCAKNTAAADWCVIIGWMSHQSNPEFLVVWEIYTDNSSRAIFFTAAYACILVFPSPKSAVIAH